MMTMTGIPQGMRGTRCDTLVVTLALALKGQEGTRSRGEDGYCEMCRWTSRSAVRQAGRQIAR
jgi:hypothetical protein